MTYPTYGPGFPVTSSAPQPQQQYRPTYLQQPYGPPWTEPPPARRTALPWLIGGLVALLVAGGIGLVFLVVKDEGAGLVADPPAQSAPDNGYGNQDGPAVDPRPVPSAPTDCLVECSETDAPGGPDSPDPGESNYTGSDDAAVRFVQAIADGDVDVAHDALCGAGKTRIATPEELVADFYATFGFTRISGARLTEVYPADSEADAVVFELETDAGDVVVEVYIVEEGSSLAVCGYDFS